MNNNDRNIRRTDYETLSAKDTAKMLRRDLKAAFPGVKFGVRGSRGTGYGSYTVSWVDGPSTDAVEKIADPYQGKSFNGSDDSTVYHRQPVGVKNDGTPLVSGIGYLHCSRSVSEAAMAKARAELERDGWSGSDLAMNGAARMVAFGETARTASEYHPIRQNA